MQSLKDAERSKDGAVHEEAEHVSDLFGCGAFLGCIFLFHVPSWGVAKRRRKIQCSGNSSFPAPFPFFSVPFGSAKRNTQFEENRRKRKS